MNQHLQQLLDTIQRSAQLSEEEKLLLVKTVKNADKDFSISEFKLDRTEKVKRTTAILLEETIEELEQKRKAVEAQNKELEIESALERVRTVAMGMKTPDDILSISEVLFYELRKLGFENIRNAVIHIFKDENNYFIDYDYSEFLGGSINHVPYTGSAVIEKFMQDIRKCKDAFSQLILSGDELDGWKEFRRQNNELDDARLVNISALCYYIYSFGAGSIGISTFETIAEEKQDALKRFRNVFDFAYKRYTDVAQAEAQAKEARIEAALERVRSKTMAMHHSNELAETSSVLFQQIKRLGFETWSCGFGIWRSNESTELWMGADAGELLPPMIIPYTEEETHHDIFQAFLEKKSSHHKIWEGEALRKHYEYLKTIPSVHIAIEQLFAAGLSLPQKQCYYVGFFKQGYLLLITKEPNETLEELARRFASVFDLTYTRFLDLKNAEAHAVRAKEDLLKLQTEKKRAEDALGELQLAQKQLIQSEKMASLGELTAGIAHEIQNPLNFVNNFSEVSEELIDEMKAELTMGNHEVAMGIADDLKQNLGKINHHGKRADAIVKGMLQHSRSGGSVKEATDINALVDEYVRLCYHGLRAKDKSFNSAINTNFDDAIGKFKVIPQDIGRVMLNLMTNAFYAVDHKRRRAAIPEELTNDGNYAPVVTVTTKRENDKVSISVADNGNGIPKNIVEKIFQPFFTTKPTGQGTGLGLSLAYDIVRAHGGEIKVETKENEGTTFIIQLPSDSI